MKINKIILGIYVLFLVTIIIKLPFISLDIIGKKFYYEINETDALTIENRLKNKNFFSEIYREENKLVIKSQEKPQDEIFRKCNIEIFLEREITESNFSVKNYTNYFIENGKAKFLLLNSSEISSIILTSKTATFDKLSNEYLIIGAISENIPNFNERLSLILENFEKDINNIARGNFLYVVDNETFGNVEISKVMQKGALTIPFLINGFDKKDVEKKANILSICGKSKPLNYDVKYLMQEFYINNSIYFFIGLIIAILLIPLIKKSFNIYKEMLIFVFFLSLAKIMNENFEFSPIYIDWVVLFSCIIYTLLRIKENLFKKYLLYIILMAVIISLFPIINKAGIALMFFSISFSIRKLFDKLS